MSCHWSLPSANLHVSSPPILGRIASEVRYALFDGYRWDLLPLKWQLDFRYTHLPCFHFNILEWGRFEVLGLPYRLRTWRLIPPRQLIAPQSSVVYTPTRSPLRKAVNETSDALPQIRVVTPINVTVAINSEASSFFAILFREYTIPLYLVITKYLCTNFAAPYMLLRWSLHIVA